MKKKIKEGCKIKSKKQQAKEIWKKFVEYAVIESADVEYMIEENPELAGELLEEASNWEIRYVYTGDKR